MNWNETLGRLLTAFTIEFDHEVERRLPHTTTVGGGSGPWLVSMAFWANFLALVPEDGWPLAQARPWAEITNLAGFQRWGYVRVADEMVRLSRGGRLARRLLDGLTEEIEDRWRARFGADAIDALVASAPDPTLPALPLAGMTTGFRIPTDLPARPCDGLAARLAAPLLALTRTFEQRPRVSLAAAVDLFPYLSAEPVELTVLGERSGVSREAIAAFVGGLERRSLAAVATSAARRKTVALTAAGVHVREQALADLEAVRGAGVETDLLTRRAADGSPLLSQGLVPPDGGWRWHTPYARQTRAFLADPLALPAHPLILHRGGFPDGS